MSTNKQWQFIKSLADTEYRKAVVDDLVGTGLAFQIRQLRNARTLTQKALADQIGNNQVTISQWENPNYGKYSLSSLKELAAAFDVGLLVRFVSFGELADWTIDVSPERLVPKSYGEELQLSFWDIKGFEGELAHDANEPKRIKDGSAWEQKIIQEKSYATA